jgi:hypothetical protein
VGGDFLLNLATFGFFQGLGAVLRFGSLAGARAIFGLSQAEMTGAVQAVRGGDAVSTGAARAVTTFHGLQLTATAASFITLSFAQFRLTRGRLPTAGEAAMLAYESILTVGLLQVGAHLAEPLMGWIGLRASARQLAALDPAMRQRVEAHFGEINALQRRLAGLAATPQATPREARAIAAEQTRLLGEQRQLVNDLRAEFRRQGAAAQVDAAATRELARIEADLAALRDLNFLADAGIRPLGEPLRPEDPLEFTYQPGGDSLIRQRFGEGNVRAEANGVLRAQHEGRAQIYYPESMRSQLEAQRSQAVVGALTRQQSLAQRQQSIVERATALGLGDDPAIVAIRNRRPLDTTGARGLNQTERLIERAEETINPQIREQARAAYDRHRDRLRRNGMSIDNVRSGELANLTREQVGEALARIPTGLQNLGEAELRGVLYAVHGRAAGSQASPIDIGRLASLARSSVERANVLSAFGALMEARVPGAYEVVSTMTANANNWRGGAFMLQYARVNVSIDRIAAFEVTQVDPLTGGMRRYDIVLTNGDRVELKDWRNWFPDSLQSQYRRDILLSTNDFADPNGLHRVQWVFRGPEPRPVETIRDTMRTTLQNVMNEFNLTPDQRADLGRAFDTHPNLITVTNVTWDSAPLWPVVTGTPNIAVPVLPRRDEPQPQVPPGVAPLIQGSPQGAQRP